MKFKIKINYGTGDSFNSYPENEDYLDFDWVDLDIVKENLNPVL